MTPKERVLAVFEHRPTDQVPLYQAGFSSHVASYILGRPEAHVGGGIQQWRESKALWEGEAAHREFLERCQQDALDLAGKLELDYVRPSYWRMTEKPTAKLDEYTFQYGDPNGAYRVMRVDPRSELYQTIEQKPDPEPTLEDIERSVEAGERSLERFMPPTDVGADIKAALARFPDRAVPVGGAGISISNRSQAWLEAVALRPDLVARHLEVQCRRAEQTCEAMAKLGFPFIAGGGDFASNKGPNYSPKSFHELMAPRLKRITEVCNRHGGFHMCASDGNLWRWRMTCSTTPTSMRSMRSTGASWASGSFGGAILTSRCWATSAQRRCTAERRTRSSPRRGRAWRRPRNWGARSSAAPTRSSPARRRRTSGR